ncbi:phosphonatase-like hydrolase [Leifsonia sp. 98AMF]|uniref:phosphonatase-like hydrolase n=1 Tax=unclassified Leifsonia TaxID=2663824 RepID=UPI00087C0786|nr:MULTISPECIES: phosphonatase-like hydrolase [unclassified Leifsonia]SDH67614.1 phosphonatase-like hydrolase [Leifsonia sp. 197AMF]SDI72090.1 phosphonatase-like hydrolase [Leifsonia sp. 466MF]SDK17295.1 phosphonatase-like hydrolase [Leifsonia sp. 157MF]SDN74886.1 phosphonatase-like hydrolase [Leifsonia sp. 509MF]SEN33354.1 phosphonatase-like hydrolase [Leifsonia sp. 467MF]
MTPDGRITSEFDDVTVDIEPVRGGIPASAGLSDEEWDDLDDLEDGLDEGDADDRDEDDLADLELVVLDLAGTTVLDDGLVQRAFERAVDAAGLAETPEQRIAALDVVRETMGQSKLAVFRSLSADEDQAQHADAVFESTYAELIAAEGLQPVPGAEDLIRRLRATGVKVALTTGFSRRTRDVVLDALGWRDLADVTLTPAEAGRGRPYPDLPLTALLRTGASSVEGMVVVGDTASDIASGIAAGAGLVVGVLTGAHDEQTLLDAGADAVLPSVADLPELLGYEVERDTASGHGIR